MSGLSQIAEDYFTVEEVIQERSAQAESVRGKDTPYRVAFRYRGMMVYKYYESLEDAELGTDKRAGYGPTGRAYVEYPRSQRIQVRGPRGGWSWAKEQKR